MTPTWISAESWKAFEDMRKKIKAPLTDYAAKLIVTELCKLKSSGEDPQACLDQSIRNGWRDVFPQRDKGLRAASSMLEATQAHFANMEAARLASQTPEAKRAKEAAMAAIRRVA